MLTPVNPMSVCGQLNTDIHNLKSEITRKADNYRVSALANSISVISRQQSDIINSIQELTSICDGILSRIEICEEKLQNKKIY